MDRERVHLRSEYITREDFEVGNITDDEFMESLSLWEKKLQKGTKEDVKIHRELLLNILDAQDIGGKKRQWYLHRWTRCLFDSISPSFFLMTEIFVPSCLSQDEMFPYLKEEVSGMSDLGRKDATYLDLHAVSWGKTGNTSLVREKLNGVHVEAQVSQGRTICSLLGMTYAVDHESPSELMEWTENGLFSLSPYGLPTHSLGGIPVKDHKWQVPNQEIHTSMGEGIMLLQGTRELRLKRNPSIEVDIDGEVWECALGEEGLFQIRPRYGKSPQPVTNLKYYPSMIDMSFPNVTYELHYVYEGPYSGQFTFHQHRITIDSGYRMGSTKLVHIDEGIPISKVENVMYRSGIYYYTRDGRHYSGPEIDDRPSKSGAKAVVVDASGHTYWFKDEDKPFDYIGGTIMYGEAPVDCVIREIFEETGSRIAPEKLVFIGVSSSKLDDGFIWHSYMYIILLSDLTLGKFSRVDPKGISQYWTPRLTKFVSDQTGDAPLRYYESHVRVNLRQVRGMHQRVLESIVGKHMSKRFYTGPDVMAALYHVTLSPNVDFELIRHMISGDFRITPYLNVMCEHTNRICDCSFTLTFNTIKWSVTARNLVDDVVQWILSVSRDFKIINDVVVDVGVWQGKISQAKTEQLKPRSQADAIMSSLKTTKVVDGQLCDFCNTWKPVFAYKSRKKRTQVRVSEICPRCRDKFAGEDLT